MINQKAEMYRTLGISREVWEYGERTAENLRGRFRKIDEIAEYNQLKVIRAMQENRVSEACLYASSGYGYNDTGRDTLEKVYASAFRTEDALVRPQIACGTHALTVALSGNLRPGDELFSPVGKPYDTLEEVIGIRPSRGSLAEYGITYRQTDLLPDGSFDYEGIRRAINEKTKLVTIQRSKGYQTRPTLSVDRIGELIHFIKEIRPDVICMVDNCYGEFVEEKEPSEVGADLLVGSLIKNPGGGLAPIGGYIAGKKEYVENAACRLTSPGLGKEVGATLGVNQAFYQGFFLAPTVTASALKGAVFAANIYEQLGFPVIPNGTESRHDIIQAVTLGSPEAVIAFCRGIQAAAPVDSYVAPEPWAMPGYDSDVIMAAGAFVQGSSIELSADGPIKPPYAVYFQGGLTWEHAKLGILMSLQKLWEAGLARLPDRKKGKNMKKRIVIIGGGASGLMAAVMAARNGASVTVLEQNEKPGKKLLATGNGRCNLTNLSQESGCYRGNREEFVWKVIQQFPVMRTISFFSGLGIYTKNRDGWIYPNSDQASSVLQVLLLEAASLKVKLKTREQVLTVKKENGIFYTQTGTWVYESEAVIVACGSPASAIEGSSDTARSIAENFGHTFIPFLPALVPLKGRGSWFSKWAGVRVQAAVTLMLSGKPVCTESGEVQLTDYGLSGIPVFQLSRFVVRGLAESESAMILLDFMPGYEKEGLQKYLEWRWEQCPYKTLQQLLIGLIPDRLIPLVAPAEADLVQTVSFLKEFPVAVRAAAGLAQAQVCSGGVSTDELTEFLESTRVPGLYFTGESADVDGRCGGYNLQWAWSSGAVAGNHSSRQ